MPRIVHLQELTTVLPINSEGRIVLTGGCFDILHLGHVRFLSEARAMGDYLVVLLESDERAKELKGRNRPFCNQEERAEMLSALRSVDLIVLLPTMGKDSDYLNLLTKIKPDIIAIAENDPHREKRKRQAKEIGAELEIVSLTKTFSTSKLAKVLGME